MVELTRAEQALRAAARAHWRVALAHLAAIPSSAFDLRLVLVEAQALANTTGPHAALERLASHGLPGGLRSTAPHPTIDLMATRLFLAMGEWQRAELHAQRAASSPIDALVAEGLELWAIAANHSGHHAECLQAARQRGHPMRSAHFAALIALERLELEGRLSISATDEIEGGEPARHELLSLVDAHACRHAPHLAPTLREDLWPDPQRLRVPRTVATYLRLPDLYPTADARRSRLDGLARRVRQMADIAEATPLPLTSVAAVPFRLAYQLEDHLPIQRHWSRFVQAIAARNVRPADLAPTGDTVRIALVSSHLRGCTVHNYFAALYDAIIERMPDVELIIIALGRVDAETKRLADKAAHFLTLPNDHRAVTVATDFLREHRPTICLFPEVGMEPVVNLLAAHRHAPVQMCLWGHPASTALGTIDAFITIDAAEPPDAERHYTERLIRLPGLGTRFSDQPMPTAPSTQRSDRPLTLACAQSAFKWQPEFIDAVGHVLARLPHARLVAFQGVDSTTERALLHTLAQAWRQHGVEPSERVRLHPRSDRQTFLSRLAECHVALDTFLFSGGQTTYDSLSVGLAPITLPGTRMRGRQSAAVLSLLDMEDAIATSCDDWIERVLARCSDPELRQFDRERIQTRLPDVLNDEAPVGAFVRWIEAIAEAVTVHRRDGRDAVDLAGRTMAGGAP